MRRIIPMIIIRYRGSEKLAQTGRNGLGAWFLVRIKSCVHSDSKITRVLLGFFGYIIWLQWNEIWILNSKFKLFGGLRNNIGKCCWHLWHEKDLHHDDMYRNACMPNFDEVSQGSQSRSKLHKSGSFHDVSPSLSRNHDFEKWTTCDSSYIIHLIR